MPPGHSGGPGPLARRGVQVSHCPESNLLARGGAIPELLAAGVTVGLGTGRASTTWTSGVK
jgi:cytosine/adenosine deaminase-related metal-dependent hydrolase